MLMEGRPLKGRELENLKKFLARMDLNYDEGIEYSVCMLNENYEVIGTGSVDQNVIKCVAIDPAYQGQGLSAAIISNLVQYEFEKSRTHIFIYTKPKNHAMFADMGFHTILMTDQILFMENRTQGFSKYLKALKEESEKVIKEEGIQGAIVANCNPFTRGHQYLIESALRNCDYLHLFILSDDRSRFSASQRYEMVKRGLEEVEGKERVILHRTSDYMISAATFPTYFFKEKMQAEAANCDLDLKLFASRIAPELGIVKRFVGTEPFCQVTRAYNCRMKEILPEYGIQVEEVTRKEKNGVPVSASNVRRWMNEKEYVQVRQLVPENVYEYMLENGILQ
ncbi:MAG: [citrate (pro-3S)-lyase] ligase [Dorea sp.]